MSSGEHRAITHGRLPVSRRKEVFHGSPAVGAYLGTIAIVLYGVRNRANRHRDRDAVAQISQRRRDVGPSKDVIGGMKGKRNRHQELSTFVLTGGNVGVARPPQLDVPAAATHRTQIPFRPVVTRVCQALSAPLVVPERIHYPGEVKKPRSILR